MSTKKTTYLLQVIKCDQRKEMAKRLFQLHCEFSLVQKVYKV